MARLFKVFCALLTCVVLSQPSYAFPSFRSYDSCYDVYDDFCADVLCGYIPYPEEPHRPIQVIQGGPTCHRCQPLSYQVQVPVPPPAAPYGQQYGVKVEVPHSAPCNPCVNVGYEIETPITPCTSMLPNLPVSVTVPAPHYDCHQPCHINYELEVPVAPCTPLLSNLKTQVDRVVLPCPCTPPISEGYVPESEPTRRKRFVDWHDCDYYDDDYDDESAYREEDEDYSLDERPSRTRRSATNWRPRSTSSSRSELFPASRLDQSPRSNWMMDNQDYDDSEPVTQSRRSTNSRNQRIVSRGFDDSFTDNGGGFGDMYDDDGRIVSPDSNDDGRVRSRGLGGRNDDGRIVSRGLGDQIDDGRIVSRGSGDVNDPRWRPEVSSDPVERRRVDPNFVMLHEPYYMSVEDRMLLDSLLSSGTGGSEQSGVVNAQLGTSGGTGGPTVIDNTLGAARSQDPPRRRLQSSWNGGLRQNSRDQQNNEHDLPNRTRLNGSSGTNRRSSGQNESQNRITTPSTNRSGGRQRSQGSNGSDSQNDAQGQGSRQGMDGSQRKDSSNTMNSLQRQSGTQPTRNRSLSQQRGDGSGQGGSQQRQSTGSSQQRGGGSQGESSSHEGRIESRTRSSSPQRTGGSQGQNSSQRARVESQSQGSSQQRGGGSQSQRSSQQTRGGSQGESTSQQGGGESGTQNSSQQRTGGSQGQNSSQQGRIESRSQGVSQQRAGGSQQRQSGRQSQPQQRQQEPQRVGGSQRDSQEIPLSDYIDYYEQLGFPGMSGLPPARTFSSQRTMNPVETSRSWSSQTRSSVRGQNLNDLDYPLQPPSAFDSSRIVTPSTYDTQPFFSNYDFDYY